MRNYINNIRLMVLAIAVMVIPSACTDNFGDYNRLWDEPTDLPNAVAYGLLLKDMQTQVIPAVKNKYQMNENLLGGGYGRYFASAQAYDKGWSTSFIYYNPSNAWINSPFETTMTGIYGSWIDIKNMSNGEGINYAWAQVLRIAAMQRLTDIQGPIPYSEMGKSSGLTTAYDSQEDAYMAMFADLDDAIKELTLFATSAPGDRSFAQYDLLYGGDMSKWVKFANSLKLRMAMRISYVNPAKAQEYAEAAISHPYGVITSNSDNAAIELTGTGDQNPLRWLVEDYLDVVAGAEIVTYMNSYNDPRRSAYFKPSVSGSVYAGLRLSANSQLTWRDRYSLPNVKNTDKLMWLSASEVAFLRAEMALNKWAAGGTAQGLYEEGIALSFAQNGLSAADAADYYSNSTLVPTNHVDARGDAALSYSPATPYSVTIAWDDKDGDKQKLEKIITQKWIALYPLGTEAWSEQRRTGYPRFYPTINNKSLESGLDLVGPSRLLFPPSEAESSPENYAKAVQLLGGADRFGTKLWWDVKTDKPAW